VVFTLEVYKFSRSLATMTTAAVKPPPPNNHAQKAMKKAADTMRLKRQRVCNGCVRRSDLVLGGVYSDDACQRCGVKPCCGVVVAISHAGAEIAASAI
jgi:hypothetical protein